MTSKRQRKILPAWLFIVIYVAVICACVGLDQATKAWVFNLTHSEKLTSADGDNWWTAGGDKVVPILGDWLTFDYITNDGATGGILGGKSWLFFVMTLIGLPVFCWLLWRSRTRSVWGQIAFAFVTGGTLGNAIDRLFLAQNGFFTGEVRDFVRVEGFFGIFNVADSFLVVGVIMALLAIVFFDPDALVRTLINEHREKAKQSQPTEGTESNGEQPTGVEPENPEQPSADDSEQPKPETQSQIEANAEEASSDGAEQSDEKD